MRTLCSPGPNVDPTRRRSTTLSSTSRPAHEPGFFYCNRSTALMQTAPSGPPPPNQSPQPIHHQHQDWLPLENQNWFFSPTLSPRYLPHPRCKRNNFQVKGSCSIFCSKRLLSFFLMLKTWNFVCMLNFLKFLFLPCKSVGNWF